MYERGRRKGKERERKSDKRENILTFSPFTMTAGLYKTKRETETGRQTHMQTGESKKRQEKG